MLLMFLTSFDKEELKMTKLSMNSEKAPSIISSKQHVAVISSKGYSGGQGSPSEEQGIDTAVGGKLLCEAEEDDVHFFEDCDEAVSCCIGHFRRTEWRAGIVIIIIIIIIIIIHHH